MEPKHIWCFNRIINKFSGWGVRVICEVKLAMSKYKIAVRQNCPLEQAVEGDAIGRTAHNLKDTVRSI